METRELRGEDRVAAEAFLVQHRDSSMFLRSNLSRRGVRYTGRTLEAAEIQLDEDESLFALSLASLREPPRSDEIACRPPRPDERDELVEWRFAYEVEALGATPDAATRETSAAFLDMQLEAGHVWIAERVAEHAGRLASLSAFNAALPDIVQLGGIYTPPELRGRSYAKHVVAAQLRAAREQGVGRAVLFTKNPNAVRCYETLGFRRIGEFSLILLR